MTSISSRTASPEVQGNTSQKTRAPNTAAEATNQSSIAAPTPAITSRNGSSSNTTATTVIPNSNCPRTTATSGFADQQGCGARNRKFATRTQIYPSTKNGAAGSSRP